MRQNMFGEKIAQPGDDYHAVDMAFLDRYGEPMNLTSADIEGEEDENFKWGGEAGDDDGNRISFDGFESLEAAKAYATGVLRIPARYVQVLD